MRLLRRTVLQMGGCALLTGLGGCEHSAHAQSVTRENMVGLLPDEHELQGFVRFAPTGFVRIRPASESPDHSGPRALPDAFALNLDLEKRQQKRTGWRSIFDRGMYSADGRYALTMTVKVYDTAASARDELADHFLYSSSPHTKDL